jgi:hypothetical protein
VGVLPRARRRNICDSRNLSIPSLIAAMRAAASVELHDSCTSEDGLDRTRPSLGSTAIGSREGLGRARYGHVAGEVHWW